MTEGLFDDHAGPAAILLLGETGLAELLDDGRKESGGHGQIKKAVPAGVVLLVDIGYLLGKALIGLRVLKVALDIINALREPGPYFGIDLAGRIFGNLGGKVLAKALRVEVVAGKADDGELLGKQIVGGKIA